MRRERLQQIEDYINDKGFVRMEDIRDRFEIAMPTVRKDISELASMGHIEKVYGGAKSVAGRNDDFKPMHVFKNRATVNLNEKEEIARKAAALVSDGDVIYIDSGTTAAGIIEHLEGKRVTVLTSNLAAINAIANTNSVEVYILGGKLDKETMAVDNARTFELFRELNITKAFMAATGYSFEGGIAQDTSLECDVKKYVLGISTDCYLTIDSSKIGKKAMVRYASMDEIRSIITAGEIDREYIRFFEENGINII